MPTTFIVRALVLFAILFVAGCGAPEPVPGPLAPSHDAGAVPGGPLTVNFDSDKPEQPPAGFVIRTVGPGRPSQWLVKAASDAPSGGQVLMQCDNDDTNGRFPTALIEGKSYQDVRVSVRGKAISGNIDRSIGVIVRAKDEKNYYLARANTANENVRLYVFKNGKRSELAEWEGDCKPGVWHTLQLEVKGDQLTVTFNGKQILQKKDATFAGPGLVGLWTKAESVSQFDDFTVTPITP